jgi:murein DD-endopeptidase MepM/ murein hydrolase activator NlpD
MGKSLLYRLQLIAIVGFTTAIYFSSCDNSNKETESVGEQQDVVINPEDTMPPREPIYEYGFCLDSFTTNQGKIKKNWTLSHLLLPYGVSQAKINKADQMARDTAVGLKYVKAGKKYTMLNTLDTLRLPQYCIYEKNNSEYVVFDFTDSVRVHKVKKEVKVEIKELSGVINQGSSLDATMGKKITNANVRYQLVGDIAAIFAWTIDFFKIHAGDKFKILYEERSVDGVPIGIGEVYAVYFDHKNTPYYAFQYTQNGDVAYYDEQAKGMKKPFLKAPLKYIRISSAYSKRRFHPVTKRYKAHLGTDYAAPTGTPIWSTADGTIEAAGYGKYNGNYVKVRHNDTYQTGYLHMSKIASGMKRGARVKQGDVIGYVGSTGLATGPHVCYRFWKNKKQIDPRSEKFQSSEPVKSANLPTYQAMVDSLKPRLDSITFATAVPSVQ